MNITPEQLIKLAKLGYDEECEHYYNTVTDCFQHFSSNATVKWPDISDVLWWFRKKGYKYSITPEVLSSKVNYEIYTHTEVVKVDSWEEAEYEILSRLIEIEYDNI